MRSLNLISVLNYRSIACFNLTYNSRSLGTNSGFGYVVDAQLAGQHHPSTSSGLTDDRARLHFSGQRPDWVLDYSQSLFEAITLTSLPANEWRISYFPDGEIMEFDSNGRLKLRKDTLGNAVVAIYNGGGQLTALQEQAIGVSSGRSLSLSYSSGSVTVTDPKANSYVLSVDSNGNLTQVSGPEGCLTAFSYATPGNHLITGRTDPVVRDPQESPLVSQAWSYTFGSSGELTSVTDSRGLSVSYSYSTVSEFKSGPEVGETQTYNQTTVVDARSQTWTYVFDLTGNLRRAIDPNFHQRRLFWSDQSRLLYEASGYLNRDPYLYSSNSPMLGIRDNPNMRFRRYVYDDRGNLRQSFDGNGLMTDYQYSQDRLVEVTPGRANFSVQGEWEGHYGSQGYYLCGPTGSSDISGLPGYISALVPGTGSVAPRRLDYASSATGKAYAYDARCLTYSQDGTRHKARGCWKSSLDGSGVPYRRFQFSLQMASPTNFNLSLYTCAIDQGSHYSQPFHYWEQSGYDVELLVTDSVGTQSCRINNNQGGAWVTFAVQPGSGDVLVEVRARGGNNATLDVIGDAVLSAIAFDAYENRTSRMSYTSAGLLASASDAAGHTTTYTYNSDGTLASLLEPGQSVAYQYTYGDAYKNLTQIQDPLLGQTQMTYDLNGNVESVQDAEGRTSSFLYDGKNRMIRLTDALGSQIHSTFDAGGRLVQQQDQEGRVRQFAYKHNRLWKTTDPLGQTMLLTYTNSGQVDQVTDWRGQVSGMVYDAADQLVEVQSPDATKLRYALDSLGRVAAITSANGNLSDVNAMVVSGAKNILFNPEAEEIAPHDPNQWASPAVALKPRYWTPATTTGTRATESTGNSYFPLNSSLNQWEQKDVPASAGGRYLASFLARKEDSSSSVTTVRLEFQHRLHKDYPNPHADLSNTIPAGEFAPSSSSWTSSPRTVVDIAPDIQCAQRRPALASTRIKLTGGSAPLGVDKVQLLRLSTCLEYDGENLREVCFADGARQRTEFDRLGRAYLTVDPDGRMVRREFDGLDRIVHVVDSLGNELYFQYDNKRDLALFRLVSQGVNQDTQFEWDSLHRLTKITYPDASYEQFTYSATGDLKTYRDNMARVRSLDYDSLHRLKTITYSDSSTVQMSYDRVSNLTRRDERNGDFIEYFYDGLNRLTDEIQYVSSGAQKVAWAYTYNGNGQLMSLSEGGARYGKSRYGAARYGPASSVWSVPGTGRDEVGRLLAVQDQNASQHDLAYDPEGRLTRLSHPNTVQDLYRYDVVGKLLDLQVKKGSTVLMEAHYGYNLSRDRLAQHTDLDCFNYLTDQAGRLVEEAHNRFCIHQAPVWLQGQWDKVSLDPASLSLSLLPLGDSFSSDGLQLQRWKPSARQIQFSGYDWDELRNVGLEIRQNDRLQVAYPRAMGAPAWIHRAPIDNMLGQDTPEMITFDGYNATVGSREAVPGAAPFQYQLEHAQMLQGDFDVAVDYQDLEGIDSGTVFAFCLQVTPTDGNDPTHDSILVLAVRQGTLNRVQSQVNGSGFGGPVTAPAAGQLRLARTGSTYTAYYRDQGASTWSGGWTTTNTTADVRLQLVFYYFNTAASISVSNLQMLSGNQLAPQGTFTSPVFDAGRIVSFDRIQWTESLPSGCDVELEVALADNYDDFANTASPPVWFGPSGAGTKFTTPGGENLPSGKTGRYAMVRATLTGTGSATPTLSDIQLSCNAASATGSRVKRYLFDEAGNIRRITTVDDTGSTTDERDGTGWSSGDRINTLNQIMRQDVGGDTWTFTYDLNGNMTEKTNGVDTWTYTWNDENRLVRVQGPSSVDVAYAYDDAGRMMSRDDGTDVTTFFWAHQSLIRESTGMSTTTYCIPEEQLLSFIRDGERYDVHTDALGSVRMVTDSTGAVVARFDYSAWGELLASSFDSVPGGMPYRFVGSYGCRTDLTTGLVYMRARHYDPSIQRFISRDPLAVWGSFNLYEYCSNSPVNRIDPAGLQDWGSVGGSQQRQNRLQELLNQSKAGSKFAKDVAGVLAENKVQFGVPKDPRLNGFAGKNGKILLNITRTDSQLVGTFLHEILHKILKKKKKKFKHCPDRWTNEIREFLETYVVEHAWIDLWQSRLISELVEQDVISPDGLEDYLDLANWDKQNNPKGNLDEDWNYLMNFANEATNHGLELLPGLGE
ncbi:MAG: RHS repeat-associated core domain-containing protein [Vulcanimicrobiota bacterium]